MGSAYGEIRLSSMIAVLLLIVLTGICLGMVLWTMRGRDRIFQYPFLSALAFLIFFVPQFVGIVRQPISVPKSVLSAGGVELMLIMTILCAGAGFVGYLRPVRPRWARPAKRVLDPRRLFRVGIVAGLVALYGIAGLARLSGGFLAYFSTEGNYALEWAGLPVYYNFFRMFIYPAFLMCLWSTLRHRSPAKWAVVLSMAVIPLCHIVFLGRRSEAFLFVAAVGLCYYFYRGWTPPRVIAPLVVLCAFLLMILAPDYRSHSQIGSDYSALLRIPVRNRIASTFSNEFPGEVTSACVVVTGCAEEWSYGWGRGFLSNIAYTLLPRVIVGSGFKTRLLALCSVPRDPFTKHNYPQKTGQFTTGPASAFLEFSFLGCLIYYLVAKGFRLLWERAARTHDGIAQILYAGNVYLCIGIAVGDVQRLAPTALMALIMWLPLLMMGCRSGLRSRPFTYYGVTRLCTRNQI